MNSTRTKLSLCTGGLLVALLLGIPGTSQAQSFTGHYPAGAEGIKAGSLPPPGFYLRDYNIFYSVDDNGLELFAYVNGFRPIWISPYKILGGFYGADILIPFGYSEVKATTPFPPAFTDSSFSLGDIHVEPITLSWHPQQFDFAVGYAVWIPTGDFDRRHPTQLGKGFWSQMLTAGATWYLDKDKTWAVSALNRYEFHTENSDTGITPGQNYTLEWGVSKTLNKTIDVGVVGYFQSPLGNHHADLGTDGCDVILQAAGCPAMVLRCLLLITSLRYLREFEAFDRPEGNTITLTLTKRF